MTMVVVLLMLLLLLMMMMMTMIYCTFVVKSYTIFTRSTHRTYEAINVGSVYRRSERESEPFLININLVTFDIFGYCQ